MDCIFCAIVAGEIPAKMVYRDDNVVAFLDVAPWQPGHTVVITTRHGVNAVVDPDSFVTASSVVPQIAQLLIEKLGASGINIVSNSGEAAGQSVFHTHIHVIPRYEDAPGLDNLLDYPRTIDIDEVYRQITTD